MQVADNTTECPKMNDLYYYAPKARYAAPSVAKLMKQGGIIPVIATADPYIAQFKKLASLLPTAMVTHLGDQEGVKNFISEIIGENKLKPENPPSWIKLEYFADCRNSGSFRRGSQCSETGLNHAMTFRLRFLATDCRVGDKGRSEIVKFRLQHTNLILRVPIYVYC